MNTTIDTQHPMSKPKVWVNGCFDIIHPGHLRLLQLASKGGIVRVGLDTDDRISQRKGSSRPIHTLRDRINVMQSIRYVHSVVCFDSDNELISQIKQWQPEAIYVGEEYSYENVIGSDLVKYVVYVQKYRDYSTTRAIL